MTEAELLAQPADAYMNAEQQAFFLDLLLRQREALQARIADEFDVLREQEPAAIRRTSAAPKSNASGSCACWSARRGCSTRSTMRSIPWPAANTAGAARPANRSACSACCCAPPRRCPSRRRNARNSAKNTPGFVDVSLAAAPEPVFARSKA